MTRLSDTDLAASLADSRSLLEGITGEAVRELAFPNGDRDERVVAAAAAAGYERAYLVRSGVVDEVTPDWQRPRLGIGGVGPSWLPLYQLTMLLLRARSGWSGD